jgi:hypothetical protein
MGHQRNARTRLRISGTVSRCGAVRRRGGTQQAVNLNLGPLSGTVSRCGAVRRRGGTQQAVNLNLGPRALTARCVSECVEMLGNAEKTNSAVAEGQHDRHEVAVRRASSPFSGFSGPSCAFKPSGYVQVCRRTENTATRLCCRQCRPSCAHRFAAIVFGHRRENLISSFDWHTGYRRIQNLPDRLIAAPLLKQIARDGRVSRRREPRQRA